ncbi:MAG TPA: mechanosensitive ion channel [Thermomicrobiales bacterium]|nr:mechanosensitive ion channel [Thermomicrobiales bacterium]
MSDLWDNIKDGIPGNVVGAVILLIIGWIVARIVATVVTKAARRLNLDSRLAGLMGRSSDTTQSDSAGILGKIAYYGILLFVLIAVFDLLDMPLVTQPLNDLLSGIFAYIPRLIGAVILILLAWVLATILKTVVFEFLRGVNIDARLKRLQGQEGAIGEPVVARGLSDVVFALVFLLFLPAILSALNLTGILEPVQELYDKFFAFIPNLIAAAAIIIIGWFVARFVARLIASLLAAAGSDRFAERVGISSALGARNLSGTIGLLIYVLILVPLIIAGLNALQLDSITTPASNMLNSILQFIPRAFGAAAILVISFVVGRIVAGLISSLLAGTAYDSLLSRLGLGTLTDGTEEAGAGISLAPLTGQAILAVIMWFAAIAALETLQLFTVSELLTSLLALAGHILLGVIIFVVGLLIARFAGRLIQGAVTEQSGLIRFGAQAAIMVLFGAMALRQMGVANDIINLAFGILLGAVGIAIAVAFGVGGREIAGRQLTRWVESTQRDRNPETES